MWFKVFLGNFSGDSDKKQLELNINHNIQLMTLQLNQHFNLPINRSYLRCKINVFYIFFLLFLRWKIRKNFKWKFFHFSPSTHVPKKSNEFFFFLHSFFFFIYIFPLSGIHFSYRIIQFQLYIESKGKAPAFEGKSVKNLLKSIFFYYKKS